MKIALIVPGGVYPGGEERVIPALISLIKRLATKHEVRVIVLGDNPPRHFDLFGAEVIDIGIGDWMPPNASFPYRLAKAFRLLAGQSYDVIHALWANHPGLVGGLCGKALGIPVVLSLGGGELVWIPEIQYGGAGTWKRRLISRQAILLATTVTAGSRRAMTQVDKDSLFLPLGPESEFFEGSLDREEGSFRVLQVANINKVKDPHTFLSVIEKVLARRSDVIFDWVGVDTLNGTIHSLAQKFGDRVKFWGVQSHTQLREIYRHAHVYIQTSLYESQCVAIAEAAAAGLPIVSTRVGIVDELMPNGILTCSVGDATELAESVLRLLDKPNLRMSLAREAQEWALKYNADWTASEFELVYREAMETGHDGS